MIYVVVDSASGWEIWGSTVAVPVFAEVAKQTARILNLKSDKSPNSGFTPCTRPLPDLEAEKAEQNVKISPFNNILKDEKKNKTVQKKSNFKFEKVKRQDVKPQAKSSASGKIVKKKRN